MNFWHYTKRNELILEANLQILEISPIKQLGSGFL